MIAKKPVTVPATSSVPLDKIHQGGRKPLIAVTLKPGSFDRSRVALWRGRSGFAEDVGKSLAEDANDPRDVLAALITAPQNERFAHVMANRVWKRYGPAASPSRWTIGSGRSRPIPNCSAIWVANSCDRDTI
ncbi:MAG: hypothetical protein U0744_12415 [Gemmataceae bacterium]